LEGEIAERTNLTSTTLRAIGYYLRILKKLRLSANGNALDSPSPAFELGAATSLWVSGV